MAIVFCPSEKHECSQTIHIWALQWKGLLCLSPNTATIIVMRSYRVSRLAKKKDKLKKFKGNKRRTKVPPRKGSAVRLDEA